MFVLINIASFNAAQQIIQGGFLVAAAETNAGLEQAHQATGAPGGGGAAAQGADAQLELQEELVNQQIAVLKAKHQLTIGRIMRHGESESNLRTTLGGLTILAAESRIRINNLISSMKTKNASRGTAATDAERSSINDDVNNLTRQKEEEEKRLDDYIREIQLKDKELADEVRELTKAQEEEKVIKAQNDELDKLKTEIEAKIPQAREKANEIKAAKERASQQQPGGAGGFQPGGGGQPGGAGGTPQFPTGGGGGSGYIQQAKALLKAILALMISGAGNNNPFFNIAKLLAGKSMVEVAKTLTEAGMTDEVVNKTPMLRHEALLVDTQASGLRGIFETAIQYWNQAAQANKQIAKDAQQLAQRA